MIGKVLLPLLALAGAAFAVRTVVVGSAPPPVAAPVAEPAQAPFRFYVAGSGLVEAASENLSIGSPLARLVAEVAVRTGDEVEAGAPLFRLDDRDLRAELEVRRSAAAAARARLERLAAAPRPEELPPAQSRVKEAEALLADLRNQLALWERVEDARAVSAEDLSRKRFAVRAAEARLEQAQAQLGLLRAGTWKADLEVARADLAAAEAQARAVETEIGRTVVRAPVKGVVLKLNARAGEFAPSGAPVTPLVLFGTLDRLHVRVDVDENDAWRFRKDSRATAFVRANRALRTELRLVRVEPYVTPKRSLTGESTERVDTRVLQAVYAFDRSALPVYVGQQMDVFIEVPEP